MLSVFSALILSHGEAMSWANFPAFFLLATSGMILAYILLITVFGFKIFKRFYQRFSSPITYLFAVMYLGFGLNLIVIAFTPKQAKAMT